MMLSKKNFLGEVQHNKKKQCILFVILMSIILFAWILSQREIERLVYKQKISSLQTADGYSYIYRLDSVILNKTKYLSGWIERYQSPGESVEIMLRRKSDGKNFILNTEYEPKDKEQYKGVEIEYAMSFSAEIPQNIIKSDDCYDVIFLYEYGSKEDDVENKWIKEKVTSSIIIYKGDVFTYNPQNVNNLVLEDNELYEMFENGILCSANSDVGMWIYLFNNKIYWIYDRTKGESENEELYIPVYITVREQDKMEIINRDFLFETSSYSVLTGQYSVMMKELPENGTVVSIKTGVYDQQEQEWLYEAYISTPNILE